MASSVKVIGNRFECCGGMASFVKVMGNRFVSLVFNVRKVFFEADVKGASSFADVELSAFGTMNDVYTMLYVRQLNCFLMFIWDLGPVNAGVGADERTWSTFCLIAWSDPWCSCGWMTQFRSD